MITIKQWKNNLVTLSYYVKPFRMALFLASIQAIIISMVLDLQALQNYVPVLGYFCGIIIVNFGAIITGIDNPKKELQITLFKRSIDNQNWQQANEYFRSFHPGIAQSKEVTRLIHINIKNIDLSYHELSALYGTRTAKSLLLSLNLKDAI